MNVALLIFIVCTAVNVIISTIKSVMTIKGSRFSAAFWNAASYGLYSYIVVQTANSNISTMAKIIVTVVCNLICVYGVKMFEEKLRKDKVWKFELTIPKEFTSEVHELCENYGLSHNYIENIGKYTIFNIYALNQSESKIVTDLAKRFNGKTFAAETKLNP